MRVFMPVAVLALTLAAGPATATGAVPATAGPPDHWVGTWASSPVRGTTTATCPAGDAAVTNQTVRNIVFASVSGDTVRVRLTNAFGTAALTVGSASVAIAGSGAATAPGTLRTLRFGGQPGITIPPGAEALSDPVSLPVHALQSLAVSVYVPQLAGPATIHSLAVQDNFLSTAGDFTASADPAAFATTISCWMFVDGVDVRASALVPGSIVAFGDSITDGLRSTVNANRRWPNDFARRLADRHGRILSIVDQGISGNRVLSDGAGVSAQARLDRDVLTQTGARVVIFLLGVNDIGFANLGIGPPITAEQLIAGYQQIVARCHNAGLKIIGGTLLPFKGVPVYWNEAGEQIRQVVNDWIRHSGAFDAVVDFATIMADSNDPQMMNPAYDSGDHLHPNDAGYQAMADAIPLSLTSP
ncbi:MAG TPA: SGNH/GDSL hydrolase family protein [Micromonosporaceae bacterium]|nr:SGNH/GDSL hydrolase family protein [Micromonosporaceae bacterium]